VIFKQGPTDKGKMEKKGKKKEEYNLRGKGGKGGEGEGEWKLCAWSCQVLKERRKCRQRRKKRKKKDKKKERRKKKKKKRRFLAIASLFEVVYVGPLGIPNHQN